jgi:hypothetical protein
MVWLHNANRFLQNWPANDFTDSAIQLAAGDISNQQKDFELLMLRHLDEIRRHLYSRNKGRIFDAGFYKIISKI